jgi:large subunit ribosomal protein L22
MKKAEVYAKHKMARISPKKVAIVLDMVRGRSLEEAKVLLAFDQTKAAEIALKVLRSAEANALNNNNLKLEELYLSDVYVNPGRKYKYGRAGAKGRFKPIHRRSSHIIIGLSSLPENELAIVKASAGKKKKKSGKSSKKEKSKKLKGKKK